MITSPGFCTTTNLSAAGQLGLQKMSLMNIKSFLRIPNVILKLIDRNSKTSYNELLARVGRLLIITLLGSKK